MIKKVIVYRTMYKPEWKERTNATKTYPIPQSSVQPPHLLNPSMVYKDSPSALIFSATPKRSHSLKQRRKGVKTPLLVKHHLLCCPFRFQFTHFILRTHKASKKNKSIKMNIHIAPALLARPSHKWFKFESELHIGL